MLLSATTVQALPRFAARKGLPCQVCHVDPSGGGMRNDFGAHVFAASELALAARRESPPQAATTPVGLGADLRVAYEHMRRGDHHQPRLDSFYLREASLYASADPWPGMTVYLAPTFHGSESVFFEAAVVVRPALASLLRDALLQSAYVKVGRFVPVFGHKLADHTAFVREQLGFDATRRVTGVELGLTPGPFEIQASVFGGTGGGDRDENAGKGVSAKASYRLRTRPVKLELGVSGYLDTDGLPASEDRDHVDSRREDLRAGVFGSLTVGRLTWIGEADAGRVDDHRESAVVERLATFQELAILAVRGLDVRVSHEAWDGDTGASGDTVHRVAAGADLYTWPGTEVGVRYRQSFGDARQPLARIREVIVAGHWFF